QGGSDPIPRYSLRTPHFPPAPARLPSVWGFAPRPGAARPNPAHSPSLRSVDRASAPDPAPAQAGREALPSRGPAPRTSALLPAAAESAPTWPAVGTASPAGAARPSA